MAKQLGGIPYGAKQVAPKGMPTLEEEQAAAKAQKEKLQEDSNITPTTLSPASELLQDLQTSSQAIPNLIEPIELDRDTEGLKVQEIRGLKAEQELLNRKILDPQTGGSRNVTAQDIQAQREATQGIEPVSLQEVLGEEGVAFNPEKEGRATNPFSSSVTQLSEERRLARFSAGNNPASLIQPVNQLRNNINYFQDQKYKNEYDRAKQRLNNGDVSNITSAAYNNVSRIMPVYNEQVVVDELGTVREYGDLFEETFPSIKTAKNTINELQNVSLALTLAGYSTVFNTAKQGLFNQDIDSVNAKEEYNEASTEGMTFLQLARESKNAQQRNRGTLLKGITNEQVLESVQSGKRDIDQYEHIYNQATSIVKQARKLYSKEMIPEEEDNYGRDAILGELILKAMIDRGEAGVYSYRDVKTKRKKYYIDIIPPDKGMTTNAEVGYEMAYAFDPTAEMVNLMSNVPTSARGRIDASKWKPGKQRVNKKGSEEDISIDEAVLSLLGGVARIVNPDMLNLIVNIFKQGDTKLAREYFKLTSTDLESTYRNAFERNLFKFLEAGDNEETATKKAHDEALNESENSRAVSMQMISNELGLLNKRLNDTDLTGKQKMKFAEWLISRVNNRIQESSRDGQSSQKATIRMIDGFAEKAVLTLDPQKKINDKQLAKDLHNVLFFSSLRSKNGEKAFEDLINLGNETLQEMNTKIMWAITYLKLTGDPLPHTYYNGDVTNDPNIKRMTPDELLKYYADNSESILNTLQQMGQEVKEWVKPDGLPPLSSFNKGSWQAKTLERGELGYHVTNILDALAYKQASDGIKSGVITSRQRIQMNGIIELDANNSNIAIQSVMGGDLQSAKILGIAFDLNSNELSRWMDTTKQAFVGGPTENPDSFYIKLADNYSSIIPKQFSDEKRSKAMQEFFLGVIDKRSNIKDMTRDLVVAGFYGLHPSVNMRSAKDLTIMFQEQADKAMAIGGYKTIDDMLDDIVKIQGANFNSILGSISISKDAKYLGALISLDGDFDPKLKTITGAYAQLQVNELSVTSSQTVDPQLSSLIGKHEPQMRRGKDGKLHSILGRNKTTADADSRFIYTEGGKNVKDVSKLPGFRMADGIAAIMTHTVDAALEKIALLTQNKYRDIALPNIPIHDANKVNGVGYLQHWVSYNMVAIPALLKEEPLLETIYKKATTVRKKLKEEVALAKKNKQDIFIGDNPLGKHRSLMHLFDYMWKYNKPSEQADKTGKVVQDFSSKRSEDIVNVLNRAAKLGWIPLDNSHSKYNKMLKSMTSEEILAKRKEQVVSPEAFDELIDLAFELYAYGYDNHIYKPSGKKHNGNIATRIDLMKDGMKQMVQAYERGNAVINSQNSG